MKNKIFGFIGIGLFLVIGSLAHEFWIAPSSYIVKSNTPFTINCYAGEDFKQALWANRKVRTLGVYHFYQNNKVDITNAFVEQDLLAVPMILPTSGNHLIAFRSKPSYIEMEGTAFNGYLKEDGIADVLNYRIQNKLSNIRSREFYQRCAKTLLQADGISDSTFGIDTGMPLEIIPLENPYKLQTDKLAVYFEYKGKPLSNYQVRTWCINNGKLIVKSFHKTNEKGVVILPVKESGEWMFSVVKMEVLKDHSKADYESFWGSFTFYKK